MIALAATIAALLFSPPAPSTEALAFHTAERFWNWTPTQPIDVRYRSLPLDTVSKTIVYTDNTRRIVFNNRYDWAHKSRYYCAIMTHEVGHVVQYDVSGKMYHSSDPNSIMYPRPSVIPRVCRRAFAG